jgi:transforming growth factor-beta-induced protein
LPKLSILCGLVKQAGIADLFAGGLFTIFAPTDDAFQLAFESFGQIEDLQVITNVLLQHVVWGSAVDSEDLVCDMTVPMANGDDNIITCKEDVFFVGGPGNDVDAFPGIVTADIDACNGVIHIIDGVLLPG